MRAYAVRLAGVVALLGALLSLSVGLGAPIAGASCAGRTPAQVVDDSDVVLAGRLAPTAALVIATEYSHEDVTEGASYVFALDVSDGTLHAGGCQDVALSGTAEATALVLAAGPGQVPSADGARLPGAAGLDLGGGMSLTTMLVIAFGGLLVVIVGGLALAVGLGLLTGRRRRRNHGADDATGPGSTETTVE